MLRGRIRRVDGEGVDEHTAYDPGQMRVAWALGACVFALQMSLNGRYGYFRDELYYLACSEHLLSLIHI